MFVFFFFNFSETSPVFWGIKGMENQSPRNGGRPPRCCPAAARGTDLIRLLFLDVVPKAWRRDPWETWDQNQGPPPQVCGSVFFLASLLKGLLRFPGLLFLSLYPNGRDSEPCS